MRKLDGQWYDDQLYYIPTMYGGVSILYRSDLVDVEEESWSMLWDERYSGKIAPIDFPVENVVQIGVGLGMPNPWNMGSPNPPACRISSRQTKPPPCCF